MKNQWIILILVVILLGLFARLTFAEKPAPVKTGALIGRITDEQSGEPIGWTTLLLQEIHRSVSAHSDGEYHLVEIPAGSYTLKTFRVGYQDGSFPVVVKGDDTTRFDIKLTTTPFFTESIVVESARLNSRSQSGQANIEISGKKLRQSLGRTIAETIDYEAGVSQRTMGPAPARPVLRGLSGDRLLVLEDGQRTGDLSATSSDHAVVAEPIAAERIEVIRGPEVLLFGSGAMGGVVNIIRDYVPSNLPHRTGGTFSVQGESVNSGFSSGMNITVPVASLALRANASWRNAENMRTPIGHLRNTTINTRNASLGAGFYQNFGFIGVAANYYASDYGIPPDPFGGHPNGVHVAMSRRHAEIRSEYFPDVSWINHFEGHYTYSRYQHSETEASGALGMEFGVITHNLSAVVRFKKRGLLKNGSFGIWSEFRDYASGGLSFTPAAKQRSAAFYYYDETVIGLLSLNGSLRFDWRMIDPEQDKLSPTAGRIRTRSFDGISAAASAAYHLSSELSAGMTLMRSFRPPTIEELYSEGPHLAAYSYEVGNADLRSERGTGIEAFIDYQSKQGSAHLAVYQNSFDRYIFSQNTGQRSWRRADLYVYRFDGQTALFRGAEGVWTWKLTDQLSASSAVSYVQGELPDSNQYLPQIPPLEGKASFSYNLDVFSLTSSLRAAANQYKTGRFEKSTDSYAVVDLSAQFLFTWQKLLHTFSLKIENVFDTEYRKHLNRVKEMMPEPGRNIKLLYRIYF